MNLRHILLLGGLMKMTSALKYTMRYLPKSCSPLEIFAKKILLRAFPNAVGI